MKFNSINLSDKMIESLKKLNVEEMTKIQEVLIPAALKGKNVVGVSDTGSGKTYAFLVPILEKTDSSKANLQTVIISPTRELAEQLYQVCNKLSSLYDDKIIVKRFTGGNERSTDVAKSGNCHIAIGTPGRIHDLFINESSLRVKETNHIVIDEADMVFEDNFMVQIEDIKSKLNDVQYLVFSATISKNLSNFMKRYLKNMNVFDVSSERGINPNIEHRLLKSKFGSKDRTLVDLLKTINPYACLIFASTNKEVERLYYHLNSEGFKCVILHGDLDARKRKRVIKDILNDKYQYVICSDIASRGLDINVVTHVISYDLPSDLKFYAHRSGRSARYDADGISYVIFDEKDLEKISKIKKTGIVFKEFKLVKGEEVEIVKRPRPAKLAKPVNVVKKKRKRVSPNYKKKARRM